MTDLVQCKQCRADLDADSSSQDAEFCAACMRERIETLEDALERIGKLCLRIPKVPIWEEVGMSIGEAERNAGREMTEEIHCGIQ